MKRGLLWSLLSTAVGLIGALVVTPVLISSLGPAAFGLYLLVLAITSYAGFFDLGITWAATRYFAEDMATGRQQDLRCRFRTLVTFLAGVGALSGVVAVTLGPWCLRAVGGPVGEGHVVLLLLAAGSFGLSLQAGLLAALLRASQRFDEVGRVAVVGAILVPLGSYVVVRLGHGITSLLVVNIGVNAVLLIWYWSIAGLQTCLREKGSWWRSHYIQQMASFSGWSSIGRVVTMIMLQIDRLVVSFLGSVSGLTYYAVPANLASRTNLLGGPMAALFFSRASFLRAGRRPGELQRQHEQATRFLAWVAVAFSVPLATLGPNFLRVWIGEEMAIRGGPILIPLTLGYAIISVGSLDAVTLEGCGRPDLPAKATLTWAILAISSTLVFVPRFGSQGIGYAVSLWLMGVGLSNMVMVRRVVLTCRERASERSTLLGVLISIAAGVAAGVLLGSAIKGLGSALATIGTLASALLALGFFAILGEKDRSLAIVTARQVARFSGTWDAGIGRSADR